MLLFGVRGFKVGRELEGVFEQVSAQLQSQPQQPQGEGQPDNGAQIQADMQANQAMLQADMQMEQGRLQADMQKHQVDSQAKMEIERMKQEYESARLQQRIAADIQIAQIQAHARVIDEANNRSNEV
jgi:Skp family chaperone for outer membrane proteins